MGIFPSSSKSWRRLLSAILYIFHLRRYKIPVCPRDLGDFGSLFPPESWTDLNENFPAMVALGWELSSIFDEKLINGHNASLRSTLYKIAPAWARIDVGQNKLLIIHPHRFNAIT